MKGGGGRYYLKLFRNVQRYRIWFLSRLGLKYGIEFDYFGLKWFMVCAFWSAIRDS